jgi:HemY protein
MICLREQLWGKAKGYLLDSLGEATHPATSLALARVAEAVGAEAEAAERYREAALGFANLPASTSEQPASGLRTGLRDVGQ